MRRLGALRAAQRLGDDRLGSSVTWVVLFAILLV
jgi:hypothetical protein